MVQAIDKTTSHIPLFFQDHLAAWRDGVGVCRELHRGDQPKH